MSIRCLKGVFTKKVNNFDYPTVSQYLSSNSRVSTVLAYKNKAPFLLADNKIYVFTAALNTTISSFTQSPLIVPTFYKMASSSLQLPKQYFTLGDAIQLDLNTVLGQDEIITLITRKLRLFHYNRPILLK